MIIDFHTHIFPDDLAPRAIAKLSGVGGLSACTDGTATGLLGSMDTAGITKSIILPVATKPEQVPVINMSCSSMISPRLVQFGALHPNMSINDIEQEVASLKKNGVRGVKFHPEYQDFYIDHPRYFPMYECLRDAGLIAVFHAGKDPGPFVCDHGLPDAFINLASQFSDLTIVAAHLGGYLLWDEIGPHMKGDRLFFDTSAVMGAFPQEKACDLIKILGTDRVLFGTDSPWWDQKASVAWIRSMRLSENEIEAILYRNALELLG